MRKTLLPAAAGVVLLSVTVFQALQAAPTATPPQAPAPALTRTLAAEGRVVAYPGAEVSLAAERTGRLVQVRVQEGQRVRRGELIAEIDGAELRAAHDEALARAREAEAELRLAGLNQQRRRQLRADGVVATLELDQAERDLETARARLETARAEVQRYEAQLAKTRILAPLTGTVTVRAADAGEMVDVGSPIATLADLDRLRIEGEADEADAAFLKVGAAVTIEVPGRPDQQWRGRVEELADTVTLRKIKPQDPSRPTDTRVLSVKVAFAEKTPLRLGTTVELRIDPAR
jgi:RND family efflux transporter MFP subunit